MSELPAGWTVAPIGSLCDLKNGRAFKPSDWKDSGLPIVRIQNLNNSKSKYNYYDGDIAERFRLRGGELLFAWSGTPGTSFGAHVWNGGDAVLNQHIFRIDFDAQQLDKRFFRYAINQKLDELIGVAHGGVGLRHVTKGTFERTEIVVPPYHEQIRIANKLDSVLAEVRDCRARLDVVPQILKKFREAVLEAAVSGRLTEEWRRVHGVAGGWPTAKFAELGQLGRGKSKHRPRNDPRLYGGAYPFIQTGDVAKSGGKIVRHSQTYTEFGLAQSQLWPAETLCITIAANIADTAILGYPACFPDSVVGFVADTTKCVPLFVKWSVDIRRADLDSFAPATAQKNINLAVLNAIEFPLPSLAEQNEIVRRVTDLLTFADRLDRQSVSCRASVDKLTPSVLAKAFRGELVPQDPNDGPVAEMLERIKRANSGKHILSKSPRESHRRRAM